MQTRTLVLFPFQAILVWSFAGLGVLLMGMPLSANAQTTTISTTLSSSTVRVGSFVYASALLQNATSTASGTVAYKVFSNSACTNDERSAGVKTVASSSVPNSDSLQFNAVGTFFWQAVYSGDDLNSPATSTCADEELRVLATTTKHDKDKGKHRGWVHGLPFGLFKKLWNADFPGFDQAFFRSWFSEHEVEFKAKIEKKLEKKEQKKERRESRGERRGERGKNKNDD